MDCLTILAQAAETTTSQAASGSTAFIETLWKHITALGRLEAFMFVSFGTVWLFYGWRVFKILVVISFALIGLVLGMALAEVIQGFDNKTIGGVVGMILLAVLSVPLMRWAVSMLGAISGAIFTAGIWFACGLGDQYIWAGALIGMVAGGMISFIVFKVAVILFTSMGGGALIMMGALSLLHHYIPAKFEINHVMTNYRWVLPVLVMVPMLIGLVAQHKFVKSSKSWEI